MSSGYNMDFAQVLKQAFDLESGSLKTQNTSTLVPNQYDTIQLAYTGSDLTEVTYKYGGNTIAVLTLTYSSGKLVQVDKA